MAEESNDPVSMRCCTIVCPGVSRLEDLALQSFLTLLEVAVTHISANQRVSGFSPQSATLALHAECRVSLPAPLRQRLVDLVVASGRVYNTIDLLLLEVLVAPDIRRLCVRHVRRWYRERFLHLLKSRGNGLRVVSLEDIAVPGGELAASFTCLPSLTCLTLRFACDDATLWAVGKGCPSLQELDVEGSHKVTDLGIKTLCLRGLPQPLHQGDRVKAGPAEEEVQGSLLDRLWCCRGRGAVGMGEAVVGVSWLRASLMRRSRKNACCTTLNYVNVISTSVTVITGVAFLKNSCPNAKVLVLRDALGA